MNLPDLERYRSILEKKKNINFPLKIVPTNANGLLKDLPSPANIDGDWPWTVETNPSVYKSQSNWPKITIVTPSFNQDAYIEQTIRSVLLQNYPNLEYIIIDGGSSDQTKTILKKYDKWISYWQSEKDEGQGQAINFGFSLASGDFYAWINSDDYYLQDVFFKVITNFIKKRPSFIYGYGYSYHKEKDWFELIKLLPFKDFFIKQPSLIQPSTFWKATIHQPIWEELHCALDFELWIRLVRGKKRFFIKEPLSVANIHINAKTSDPNMKRKWDEDEKRIWSKDGHGAVPHWNKVRFLNRLRLKAYKILHLI